MKKMTFQGVAGVLALVLSVGAAVAADLPSRRQPPPPPVPVAPTWQGFYVGAHIGALFGSRDGEVGFDAICTCRDQQATGIFPGPSGDWTAGLLGVQAGYNWQRDSLVYGLEADWSWSGGSYSSPYSLSSATLIGAGLGAITDPEDGFNARFRTSLDWIATARARIGLASGNVLFYATGGLAIADVESRVNFNSLVATPATIVPVSSSDSSTQLGWTIGAGVEALFSKEWSGKLEYAYTDLGSKTRQLGTYLDDPGNIRQTVFSREELTLHTIKAGLNYHF